MEYEIVPIEKLKPLEKVFPTHLKNLISMINSEGKINLPIYADRKTGVILDGSHRYAFLLGHGFNEAPVRWINYDDENIRVGTHLAHRFEIDGDTNISKEEVIRRGMFGDLYNPRTTRHFFPFRKTPIDVDLKSLKKNVERRDISFLLPDVNVEAEIAHNIGFIKEIDQELQSIEKYVEEAKKTREYLVNQVEAMRKGELSKTKMDDLFSGI